MKHVPALALVALGVGFAGQAMGCTVPRITLEPQWLVKHGSVGGITNFWLGAEVELFPPTVLTECTAGLGLAGPPVPSLQVLDVMVGIANLATPGLGATLPQFNNLLSNPVASNALQAASPGATWFGFSGLVSPFTPPPLALGDVYKLWFDIFVADADLPALMLNFANFGAGTTTDPLHPLAFSGGKRLDTAMLHEAPEPAAWALVGLGLVLSAGSVWSRRKSGSSSPAPAQDHAHQAC